MNTRKKTKSNAEATTDEKSGMTETWKGALPTKPWPTEALQAQSDSDDENVELQYNPSRGIYFHERQKPMKITKTSDPTKSVVDLYDSTDDEQTSENENS